MKTSDINLRDPFVLNHAGRYYLYGTSDWGASRKFVCHVGEDLEHWSDGVQVYAKETSFSGTVDYWAPELHFYDSRYHLFASFKADVVPRWTQALASDSPLGPFSAHGYAPLTPTNWECLDGTLYIDQSGDPWLVFCHEWLQVNDGEVCARRLSRDLRAPAGEPIVLFTASQSPYVQPHPRPDSYVTDGPFLRRLSDGTLIMLWSSFSKGFYLQLVARSESGEIAGPWTQLAPLYANDGGHGMLFTDQSGALRLAIHTPNDAPKERPVFVRLRETGDQGAPLALD